VSDFGPLVGTGGDCFGAADEQSLASDNKAPPRTVATARVAPIPPRSTSVKRFAGNDRLRRAVRLDDVADEDPGEKREPDLTLRDGQAERDRLGDAVDDEPSAA
jgi:hypothetical protein